MSRTFVLGDIHGAHRALVQVLERANFNYSMDHLIALGDVADGWPETKRCIEELLKINNLIYLFGNHDYWTLEWMEDRRIDDIWFAQGGKATIESYAGGIPQSHIELLRTALPYYQLEKKVFVHAGIDPRIPLAHNTLQTLLSDRTLAKKALQNLQHGTSEKLTDFEEVYLGHTPISGNQPVQASEIWLMDTGAGWSGVLSIMNIHTKEFFTSDPVPSLYPGVEGRKKNV